MASLLYLFGENIQVFNTTDFKPVKTIELSKTTDPATDGLSLSPLEDPNEPEARSPVSSKPRIPTFIAGSSALRMWISQT